MSPWNGRGWMRGAWRLCHFEDIYFGPFLVVRAQFQEGLSQISRRFYGPETRGRYLGYSVPTAVRRYWRGRAEKKPKSVKKSQLNGCCTKFGTFIPILLLSHVLAPGPGTYTINRIKSSLWNYTSFNCMLIKDLFQCHPIYIFEKKLNKAVKAE